MTSISIGIPAAVDVSPLWTGIMMDRVGKWTKAGFDITVIPASAAMPDVIKNMQQDQMTGNNDGLTDANRNKIAGQFETEWLFFVDYDTVPPLESLPQLLGHEHPFVCGAYYHRNDPHLPLIYRRDPSGLYEPIRDFEKGAIFNGPGYATGLGCALIHQSVFAAIRENFLVFARPNGSRALVHRDDILPDRFPNRLKKDKVFQDERGELYQVLPLKPLPAAVKERFKYPYFEMENGRTEDLGFCERAERVGFPCRIDTNIECGHRHLFTVTGEQFRRLRDNGKIAGIPEATQESVEVTR